MGTPVEDRNADIITDIQNLQAVETDLFRTLESGLASKSLTREQQQSLVDKINNAATMRESLFESLTSEQEYYSDTATNVGNIIGHQINSLDVVEKQMNDAKKRLKVIEDEKNNKLRLVEINTYYGEKYADHARIMKTIVFFCIPIIFLALLANSGILPNSIYVVLFIIIGVIAFVVIWKQLIEAASRDNMNYQEYSWGYSPPKKPYVDTSNPHGSSDPWMGVGLTCMAQACCDTGFTYVPSPTNKCVSNDELPTGTRPYSETTQSPATGSAAATNPDFMQTISDTAGDFPGAFRRSASGATSYVGGSVSSIFDSFNN